MADSELNEQVTDVVEDATVMTVPIDDTLSISGEAADAYAVGAALALKADRSDIRITVNGQEADNQGVVIVTAEDTAMSEEDDTTIAEAIAEANARKADAIEMSASDATTVSSAIATVTASVESLAETVEGLDTKTAEDITMSDEDETTVAEHIADLEDGRVVSVNETLPDSDGDITINKVPYADNLWSEDTQQVNATFLRRTSGGNISLSDGDAWVQRLLGNSTHEGFVAERLQLTVIPMEREADTITATLDEATFEAYVGAAGTYTLTHDGTDWDNDPADYGVTVTGTPIATDEIVIVWDGTSDATMTVNAAARDVPDAITATIDRATFIAYVSASTTINLYYTTGWSENPALYGITVAGDPVTGDVIRVVYVKEERGTITQANPLRVVGTGWNLYEPANGYARVVDYSDTYGYRIGGTYTGVSWAASLSDTPTTITPDSGGLFSVPGDGYVIVTGGNSTDTYIVTTWSDWTDNTLTWEAYSEEAVNLANVIASYFPYGLCKVGDTQDEIDLVSQTVYSRVMRLTYSAENRAVAEASGLDYDFDDNYIYMARETAVQNSISVDTEYAVSEHGLEYIDGSTIPVYVEILYGQNLKDKLRRVVVCSYMTVDDVLAL